MTDLARLVVALEAQTEKYQDGLDKANKRLGKFQQQQNALLGDINKRFKGFASGISGALAGIGLAFSFKGVLDATIEAEKSFALLDNAVKATGGSAGFTTQQLADAAGELQKLTTYSDDAIMGMQQLLLRFQSIKGDSFTRATKAALDLATALNMDVASAAQLVGKALEQPEKGVTQLARSGIVLSKQQQELVKDLVKVGRSAEAQEIVLTALENKYRGAAAAARDTFGGALEGLKNAFGDLLEGKTGVGSATEAINSLTDALNSPEMKEGFAAIVGGMLKIVEIAAGGASALAGFAKWVGETFAAAAFGPAADDLVRISDEMIKLQDGIKDLQQLGGFRTFLMGGADIVEAQITSYQRQLDKLTLKYNEAAKAAEKTAAAAAKVGKTGPAPGGQKSSLPSDTPLEMVEITGTRMPGKSELEKYYEELDQLTKTSTERELAQLAKVEAALISLRDAGMISAEQFSARWDEAFGELLPEVETTAERMTEVFQAQATEMQLFMQDLAAGTENVLVGGFEDAMNGRFDNILGNFEGLIQQLVAKSLAADLMGKLFGAAGPGGGGGWIDKGLDFLGGVFGGFRDGGGRGEAGKAYAIGTGAQPEVFVPDSAGTFYPRGEGMGGGGVTVNQKIYVTGQVDQRTARQMELDTARQQRMAMRLA